MLLGAYVLGGLSAQEASRVRAHLRRCAKCLDEHKKLARVPSWLDLLSAPDAATGSEATPGNGEHNGDVPGGPPGQPD
jgi:anti-sigma factor RsiW